MYNLCTLSGNREPHLAREWVSLGVHTRVTLHLQIILSYNSVEVISANHMCVCVCVILLQIDVVKDVNLPTE